MSKKSSYQGLQNNIRGLKLPEIEVFNNQYADKNYLINLNCPEFTCICPKTGLPDFAEVIIHYIPDKNCIELKSFKMYLTAFRNIGIFHEHLTNKIMDDFVAACSPRWVKIITKFNPRGGIQTMVEAEFKA